MRPRPPLALGVGALLALGAACFSLGPRPAPVRYYVLPVADAPAPDRPAVPALGVGPVRLAAYLDRRELVTRAGPARVEVASGDRWAAPLDALFASALAEQLRGAVPAGEVVAWPWPAGAAPEWSVGVEVLRFEGEGDGSAVLEARWDLRRGGARVGHGVTAARDRDEAPGLDGTVAALGRTVGALARDVAAAVQAERGRQGDRAAGGGGR